MHDNHQPHIIEILLSGAFFFLTLTLGIAGVAFPFLAPFCFILSGVCAYVSIRLWRLPPQ